MKIKLWLDDVRDPVLNGAIGYTWVKTAAEAIELLKTGNVEFASLDHDLGFDCYSLDHCDKNGQTGYDVCLFLEQNPKYFPPNGVFVHSMNVSAKPRMKAALERAFAAYRRNLSASGSF